MIPAICTAPVGNRFAERLLADTDCQALGLVERGYAALSQPGGSVSTALTGLMVIAVAFFGYRLILGRGLALSDAVGLTVKLGIVLLIATSWESWQTLAYRGLAQAPAQVASELLVGIGAPNPLLSLEVALDNLTEATLGYRTRAGIASPLVGGPAAAAATLNISAVLLTLSTVGILVVTKVILALLLALAPIMAGLILFDVTRGMAQGWIAGMAAAALAPLFVLVVAAVQFALLNPIIARLLAEQAAGRFDNAAVMPIGLVTVVFSIGLIVAVRAGSRIARGIRLPRTGDRPATMDSQNVSSRTSHNERQTVLAIAPTPEVARALTTISRRESNPVYSRQVSIGAQRSSQIMRDNSAGQSAAVEASNVVTMARRPDTRRGMARRSRAAARRDG